MVRHFIEREYRTEPNGILGRLYVAICTCGLESKGGTAKLARQGYHDHLDAMSGNTIVRAETRADRELREAAIGMQVGWSGDEASIPKGWKPGTMARDGQDAGEG